MKLFSIRLGLILATLPLLVAGTPAHAGERPFKASGYGHVDGNGGMMIHLGATQHLGKASGFGSVDGNLENPQILEIPCYLYAANGDRLHLHSVVDYHTDYNTGIGIAIGTMTFTGGTGRFQDATGSADVMFVFDIYSVYFDFDLLIDGSIDY